MWHSARLFRTGFRRVLVTTAVAAMLPPALSAQPPASGATALPPGAAPSCHPAASALTVRIVDSVSGDVLRAGEALVTVRRVSTGERLRDAEELPVAPPGRWVLFTNTTLADVRPEGETLLVAIARPGRAMVTREIRIALDATGCQPVLAEALDEIKA